MKASWHAFRRREEFPRQCLTDYVFNMNICFFECLTEAIPQFNLSTVLLRMYGLSRNPLTGMTQVLSLSLSLLSLTVAFITVIILKNYYSTQPLNYLNLSYRGSISLDLWKEVTSEV